MKRDISSSFLEFCDAYNSIMLLIDPLSAKIINANRRAVEYYGYPYKTLISMEMKDINRLSEHQIFAELKNAKENKRNHFNFMHKLSSGEIREVEVHSSPIELNEESLIISIIHDKTEQNADISSLQNDLDCTLAAIPDMMFELGLDGYCYAVRANRAELLAAFPKELLGKTVSNVLSPKAAAISLDALKEADTHGFSEGKEYSHIFKNSELWFELSIAKKQNRYSEGSRFIVLSRDITGRKESEKKLKESEGRFKALHEASSGGIIIHENGLILESNLRLSKMSGYSYNELIGKDGLLLISKDSRDFVIAQIKSASEIPYESVALMKDGKEFPIRIVSREVMYKNRRSRVTEFNDITQEIKTQEQLRAMAHYDALTNLPNRTLFADRLDQAMIQSKRRGKSLAVVYVDIDGFKNINDTYGHHIGDKLLIEISAKMKSALRQEDTLARFGGDEFVAVMVNLNGTGNYMVALQRVLDAAASPIRVDGMELQVSVSIGATIYPNDKADADILIRHADQAMYRAKLNGKNRYHLFNIDEDNSIKKEAEGIDEIAQALENREFVLHYQPKVNMKTGELVGVEALIRWQHPQKGLVAPLEFLPLTENHTIACEIGYWVINTALQQIQKWQKEGLHISVSVNVGAKQLQCDFVNKLTALLSLHPHVNPKLLQIEILESSLFKDMPLVIDTIEACTKLGVSFAIDDFGTGYSSLTYLKNLPTNLIKIDRSFVYDMNENSDDFSIIKAIIELSKAFNLNVIAEGVETQKHKELLLSLGCELAQGYGISKPMEADKMPKWAERWSSNSSCDLVEV